MRIKGRGVSFFKVSFNLISEVLYQRKVFHCNNFICNNIISNYLVSIFVRKTKSELWRTNLFYLECHIRRELYG